MTGVAGFRRLRASDSEQGGVRGLDDPVQCRQRPRQNRGHLASPVHGSRTGPKSNRRTRTGRTGTVRSNLAGGGPAAFAGSVGGVAGQIASTRFFCRTPVPEWPKCNHCEAPSRASIPLTLHAPGLSPICCKVMTPVARVRSTKQMSKSSSRDRVVVMFESTHSSAHVLRHHGELPHENTIAHRSLRVPHARCNPS
jgi:hypothetical protein